MKPKTSSIVTSLPTGYINTPKGRAPSIINLSVPLQKGFIWESQGSDTPDFRKTSRKGLMLPANSYSTTKQACDVSVFNINTIGRNGDTNTSLPNSVASGSYLGVPQWVTQTEIDLLFEELNPKFDRYLVEASSALATRYFDLGTFLAELRKTIRGFKGLLQRVIGAIRSMILRHHNAIPRMADLWLEWRYALRPIAYDIIAFVKTVNEGYLLPKREIYKERKGETLTATIKTPLVIGNWIGDITLEGSLSARGTAETLIEPTRFRIAPFTTAWELTPFSFIVDWFFNVGNSLAALESQVEFPDMQLSNGYQLQFTRTAKVSWTNTSYWTGNGSFQSTVIGYQRKRWPITSVNTTPSFNLNGDGFKLLDLLAILRTLMSNRTR